MKKNIIVSPGLLSGNVVAPPSKSAAHRAILCAAMGEGTSIIRHIAFSQDIEATISAVRALGAEVTNDENALMIKGVSPHTLQGEKIFCNESGSTIRFIIPIALAMGGAFSVSGAGRLMQRPLEDYFRICDEKHICYQNNEHEISFQGKLTAGDYYLSGNVSSQYISGLLLSLPLLPGNSRIHITTPVESVGYLEMTLDMMKRFGVTIKASEDYREYEISGNQTYKAQDIKMEGDYSQAAFYLVANALGSDIFVQGLEQDSKQGDREIVKLIQSMQSLDDVRVVDVSQVPDLVPILSVLAAKSGGVTKIVGAARLRLKESDRLHAVATELSKLGVEIKEQEDSLEIQGNCTFSGGVVDSHNDHRIAMSLAIAATVASGDVVICGADSVRKSYTDFWEKFSELGGKIS